MDRFIWYVSGTFLSVPCSFPSRATLAGIILIIYLTQGNIFFLWCQMLKCCDAQGIDTNHLVFYYLKGYQEASKKMTFCCTRMSIKYEKDKILIYICSSRFLHMQLKSSFRLLRFRKFTFLYLLLISRTSSGKSMLFKGIIWSLSILYFL